MKICFISKNFYRLLKGSESKFVGGAEIQMLLLGKELSKKAIGVSYITEAPISVGDRMQLEGLNGIEIYSAPFRYMGGGWQYLLSDYFQLWRVMERVNADFYIIKNPKFNLLFLAIFCRLKGKKSVFFSSIDSDSDIKKLFRAERLIAVLIYLLGLVLTNIIVCQAHYQKDGFWKHFKKRAFTIPNLCMAIREVKKDATDPHALWVGTNSPGKCPELFCELAKKLPDVKFKMIVVPVGNRRDDELLSIVKTLRNVEFVGFVPFEKIQKYYSEATMLVNTSGTEGFPNVFLEAWSNSTPVVSLTMNPDNVISRYNLGYYVGDIATMIEKTDFLINHPEIAKMLGENGRAYVSKFHTPEKVISQLINLFSGYLRKGL